MLEERNFKKYHKLYLDFFMWNKNRNREYLCEAAVTPHPDEIVWCLRSICIYIFCIRRQQSVRRYLLSNTFPENWTNTRRRPKAKVTLRYYTRQLTNVDGNSWMHWILITKTSANNYVKTRRWNKLWSYEIGHTTWEYCRCWATIIEIKTMRAVC